MKCILLSVAALYVFVSTLDAQQEQTDCQREKEREDKSTAPMRWNVTCDENGDYAPMRCTFDTPRWCSCYSKDGQQLSQPSRNTTSCISVLENYERERQQAQDHQTDCQREKERENNSTAPVRWNITCDENGDYAPMRCTFDTPRWCACYSKDGQQLTVSSTETTTCNSVVRSYIRERQRNAQQQLTDCQREKEREDKSSAPMRWNVTCDENGDYEPLRCTVNTPRWCACYSKEGQQLSQPSRSTTTCSTGATSVMSSSVVESNNILGRQQQRAQEQQTFCQREKEMQDKSTAPVRWNITCDENGDYMPMRCTFATPRWCSCYSKNGQQLTQPSQATNTCNCVVERDEKERQQPPVDECDKPTCERDGRYKKEQCCQSTNKCHCVDEQTGAHKTEPSTGQANCH